MPQITLTTNLECAPEKGVGVRKELSSNLARWLNKPESYCMVITHFSTGMSFGGSEESAATVEIDSLGLPEEKIPDLSKSVCSLLEQLLGLDPARIYIQFSSPPRTHWGWNGKTFG